ncbi:MAG: 4-hydroxy-3-methylbut-2-enyl diphosphate reductase [Bacteroidales bacterium]|nr:4-hydroxy-3-methylbut-2-enyl diphosphate reductase [Bacteroidales bacterium]
MALRVEIDPDAGFCGGVIRAIGTAERFLGDNPEKTLYSLGAIVHNEQELSRLSALGLRQVAGADDSALPQGSTLLIRAHGEPPATYRVAEDRSLDVIDCTCPVVLKLQKDIRKASARISPAGGQIVIFGKIGHAEVLGLLGNTSADAIVIESEQMLLDCLKDGRIRKEGPLEVFSQTTKDPDEYGRICGILSAECGNVSVHHTICRQVASRHSRLETFARGHDVIVFVSGKESSNGKVLSAFCKKCNPRTFVALSPSDIDPSWFRPDDKVGVSGATSTPKWLLEQVACHIRNFAL